MEKIKLSIIIPCYNEGVKLINNIIKINNYITSEIPDLKYEIIGVNDGSKDNTKQIMADNENILQNTRFIIYDDNKGKGGAVKEGILNAKGEWILFMDADLSTDISAIKTVLNYTDSYKFIIGSRRHKETILVKKQGFKRKFIGICCIIITNILTGLKLLDTQCGFKAIERNLAINIVNKQTINRWAFDVEYLYISKINKEKIKEIPVKWENDEDSKVSALSSSINFFLDLFKIIKNKKIYKF